VVSDVPSTARPSAAKDIVVTCGHCASQFAAPEALAGKEVKCLNCQRPLAVPLSGSSPPAARPPAAVAGPAGVSTAAEIPVACPGCQRRFLAQSWLAGKSANCPSCGQTIIVPREASQSVIDLTYDADPFSGVPSLADLDEYSSARPVATPRRALPGRAYSARRPTRGFDDGELPRWVWYAMGIALGLAGLVLLVILISSLF
jgi:ribosomal protein S27E